MRKLLCFSLMLLFNTFNSFAQFPSFNQYNASLASLSPAFIANIEGNQFSYGLRNEWPGYRYGSLTQQFSFNRRIEKINSGLGLYYFGTSAHQIENKSHNAELQYAYRIHFLKDYVLNVGAALRFQNNSIDINNFGYTFEPKKDFVTNPSEVFVTNTLSLNSGLILQKNNGMFYAGINFLAQPSYQMESTISKPGNRMNAFVTKRIDLRNQSLFLFGNYAFHASGYINDRKINDPFHFVHVQSNLIFSSNFFVGIGYKNYINNFGMINWRLGKTIMLSRSSNITIGYSFDTRPFIQNDKIKSISSHEVYIKFKSR